MVGCGLDSTGSVYDPVVGILNVTIYLRVPHKARNVLTSLGISVVQGISSLELVKKSVNNLVMDMFITRIYIFVLLFMYALMQVTFWLSTAVKFTRNSFS